MRTSVRKASITASVTSPTTPYAMSMAKSHVMAIAMVIALAHLNTSALWAAEESQASLKVKPKITREEAAHVARASVPGGRIKSGELERENGILIWSFDISRPYFKDIVEVQVDALTGRVVAQQTETPQQQALEAAADKH